MQYYKDTRSKIKAIFKELSTNNRKRIFFYGVSELAEIAYISLQEYSLILAGVVDAELVGSEFMGCPVSELSLLKDDSLRDAVVITKMDNSQDVVNVLVENGVVREEIVDLRK